MKTLTTSGAESSGELSQIQFAIEDRKIVLVRVDEISETPENWELYRKPDQNDPAWIDLCESVEYEGVLSPLELSSDYYVISGHRRLKAAIHNDIEEVPCIIDEDVEIEDMSKADRIKLLVERNRGTRVKSDSEMFLEAAAQVDPAEAIRTAQFRKAELFNKAKCSGTEVFSVGDIRRTDPTGNRRELLEAVLDILKKYRATLGDIPCTGRHIHYQLLGRNVPTSTYDSGFIYGTTRKNRKGEQTKDRGEGALSKLLTDARSAGIIPHHWIDDSTRPCWIPGKTTLARYISEEVRGMFMNFWGDIHRDQPHHVELLTEKNTMFSLFKDKVAYPLRLPLTSLRGYGSFPAARDVAERFQKSGKDKLIAVYISDLDPEGINMPSSWKKYLKYDFGVDATVIRAAVLPEQVEKYNLPPDIDV